MRKCLCYAFAVYAVAVVALSGRPSSVVPKQAARAWYELGLSHARAGEYEIAKTCFNATREIAPSGTLLWSKATMLLALTCERMGALAEADYYFASDEAKHSDFANRVRNEMPGAWRNIRVITERNG